MIVFTWATLLLPSLTSLFAVHLLQILYLAFRSHRRCDERCGWPHWGFILLHLVRPGSTGIQCQWINCRIQLLAEEDNSYHRDIVRGFAGTNVGMGLMFLRQSHRLRLLLGVVSRLSNGTWKIVASDSCVILIDSRISSHGMLWLDALDWIAFGIRVTIVIAWCTSLLSVDRAQRAWTILSVWVSSCSSSTSRT